jgi:hypothetical protein
VFVAPEPGKTIRFTMGHVLEVISGPAVMGNKSAMHSFTLERPDQGIRTVQLACPTCGQNFLLELRSNAAATTRRRKLLAASIVVALLVVGATQAPFLSLFVKALIVVLLGLFVALPLFVTSFVSKGHSGFRAIDADGKVVRDHTGHRVE